MAVLPKNVQNVFPLTPLQEGMLFHSLLEPSAGAYFQQVVWEVSGAIDIGAFEAAWNFVVARHEALRTVFGHLGTDRPLQVVLREQPIRVEVVDFIGMPEGDQPAAIDRYIAADRRTPFDLARGPLVRIHLLRRGDARWTAIWSHHHIVLDGWSVAIVLSDWVKAYASLRRRKQPALDATSPWNRYIRWLEARTAAPSESYWRAYLEGFETATPLPTLLQPAVGGEGPRSDFVFDLDSDMSRHLARWAAGHNATANAAVHAIWAILLGRYCGTSDVVFGTVVSGRPPEIDGIEQMVGNFVNTIPVRLRPADDLTIAQVLAAARDDLIASTPHQHYPLSRTQALSPLRGALLGSLMAYENYPVDQSSLDEAGESSLGFAIEGARTVEFTHYPLAVQFLPGQSLRVRIIYRSDLYSQRQLQRLGDQFRRILKTAVEDDARRIDDIDLLPAAESTELVEGLNPPPDEAVPTSVLPLIAKHARQSPEASAVEGQGLRLSYFGLARESEALAKRLRADHRIGRDDVVPLLATRDAHAILGMVSVLKAGAAYLPLDPEHPPSRLSQLIAQSHAKVVLADPASAALARTISTVPVIEIEPGGSDGAFGVPLLPAAPRDLAYVICTSGSTGEAKAVAIEHRSLGNLVAALSEAIYRDLPASLRIAVVASFAVDASVKQIYAALCGGHTLVVADAETRRDPMALSNWFVDRKIAVADVTPTMLSAIVSSGSSPRLRQSLRHLLIGGEPLPAALVSALLDGSGSLEVTNVYGPTECCVDTTAHRCHAGADGTMPIGRPLKNQRVYVLDEKLRPVPFGAPGEICIGGRGVARGYLGRPDLTADKFKPDPFAPGAYLYRTGDRGRWRGDGELEFLGRSDGQVKVRGHRIEIGEIEARLNAHPCITAAVVLTREEKHGAALIACVVPCRPLTAHALRRDLAVALPEFMLPSAWFVIPALPMTTGGKVDRALLASDLDTYPRLPTGIAHVPPRNALEQRLVTLWSELLGITEVGVEDNYFSLGGDSIKAITMVSRLHREGLALALKDLFTHPTIAELAPCLQRLEPARRQGRTERPATLSVTPMQARRLEGLSAPPARFNQTLLLRASMELDAEAMGSALGAVVARHEALRLAVRREGEAWRQSARTDASARLDVVDLRGSADAAAELAAHADRLLGGLDPSNGRLVAAAIYRQSDGDRLLISVHHFGIDAVSWRVLLEDLMVAYHAGQSGRPPMLPPATGFLDWVAALEAEVTAGGRVKELAYWSDVMSADVARIAIDDAGAPNRHGDAAEVSSRLDAAASAALVGAANSLYRTTPEELLIVGLMRALDRWNGVRRLRIAIEGNGRGGRLGGLDISRTIGWFTIVYPVVLDLPAARDPGYQVRAIKEQLRAVPADGAGFGQLRWMSGSRSASALAGEIPILFNYLGRIGDAVARHGFSWDDAPVGAGIDGALARRHEIELSAALIGNELRLNMRYGGRRLDGSKARRLVELWAEESSALADYMVREAVPSLTPSDLNYAGISLDDLERIVS